MGPHKTFVGLIFSCFYPIFLNMQKFSKWYHTGWQPQPIFLWWWFPDRNRNMSTSSMGWFLRDRYDSAWTKKSVYS